MSLGQRYDGEEGPPAIDHRTLPSIDVLVISSIYDISPNSAIKYAYLWIRKCKLPNTLRLLPFAMNGKRRPC